MKNWGITMDNTNTILLTESGDLEVYDGKKPDRQERYLAYIGWLSTKKVVKMAEGERDKLVSHISKGSIISAFKLTYPIDVSDIVTLKPTHKTPTDHFLGHLGEMELQCYFTPQPVDKEEETQTPYDTIHSFVDWVNKNFNHTKGGYRHKGDFEKVSKPVKLESLKDAFLNQF